MVRRQSPLSRIAALGIAILFSAQNVAAGPYPKDDLHANGYGYLMPRQCDQYCGYNNMYCCSAGSQCYTSAGIAGCSAANGGGYGIYTTTWTSAATYTSTYSSYFPAVTGKSGNCVPPAGSGQSPCGSICCAKDQYCAYNGQCLMGSGGGLVQTTVTSGGLVFTTQFSAPYRVTSGTGIVTGVPAGATTTGGGGAQPDGSTGGGGLSPGAIAGIVIGTIVGIILLLLLCFCCVVRGLWHGVMAIFGLGKKKETVVEEERYRRSSSRHSGHRNSWYGAAAAAGGRPSTVSGRKEKKSSGKGLLGLGAALGTLWLLLGLKKDKKKPTKSRSDVSSSYWSDSYTADSPTSVSSDRRTRRSRRSGTQVSRTSRVTRTTRVSRAPSHASQRTPPR